MAFESMPKALRSYSNHKKFFYLMIDYLCAKFSSRQLYFGYRSIQVVIITAIIVSGKRTVDEFKIQRLLGKSWAEILSASLTEIWPERSYSTVKALYAATPSKPSKRPTILEAIQGLWNEEDPPPVMYNPTFETDGMLGSEAIDSGCSSLSNPLRQLDFSRRL